MRESAIECRFRQEVEKRGGKALKWVCPGHRGVPDRLLVLPGGRTVYVEMKAPGKPLEPLQMKWAKTLKQLGHTVYKIDSMNDIEMCIYKEFGNAKRGDAK